MCYVVELMTEIFSNFTDYVEDIFQTFMNASTEELVAAEAELKEMSPAPMNTILDKESKEEAIQKLEHRKKIVVADVPPTCEG